MEETSVFDYSSPVYKALLEPNMLMGIGVVPALAILVVTIVMMNLIHPATAGIGLVIYFVAKRLCKNDAYALEVLFSRLFDNEIWRKN